jgi:hypothetical protein
MRDGSILKTDPDELAGYTSVPYLMWSRQWHYT